MTSSKEEAGFDPYLDELESSMEQMEEAQPKIEKKSKAQKGEDFSAKTVIMKQPSLQKEKGPNQPLSNNFLDLAPDISVSMRAVIGRKSLNVKDLLLMRTGQVVEMDRGIHEAIDLVVNGKVVARGELVDIDGNVGVKVLEVLPSGGK